MTASKIQMDQIRSTSATVTGENIRAGSQKKSSLSPAEGLQGASPDATCTCPSGGGSLRHPCPAHPAVEQAGGDERDFQAEGAQEVPSPVSQEYDRHLISLLRKGEALPGHQEEAADEIERLRDWNDHLNNTVLPNILNPNFLMLMKGGERLLDLCTKDGKFIGVSLNDMKDVFDWMVTHARIAPDHAALAHPSPKCATCGGTGMVDDGEITCSEGGIPYENGPVKCVKDCPDCKAQPSPAQSEQAEAGRPEMSPERATYFMRRFKSEEKLLGPNEQAAVDYVLSLLAQHDRIVGALRAVIAQLRQHKNDYMDSGQETYRALQNEIREREAEIARLDGLVSGRTAERDAALARVAELERQQPVAWMHDQPNRVDVIHRDVKDLLQRVPGSSRGIHRPLDVSEHYTIPLYAAPVAQAQHSVPEISGIGRDAEHPRAVVLYLRNEPSEEDMRAIQNFLRAISADVLTQAQHSAGYAEARMCANCRHIGINDAADYAACHDCNWTGPEPDEDKCPGCAGENCMAAACPECGCRYDLVAEANITAPAGQVPQAWLDVQAERRRQITAEGWTPEHDDEHDNGEMARAAACYALAGSSAPSDGTAALLVSLAWPWDEQWWKPSTARRDMVKACALALAEIERLDRACISQSPQPGATTASS
ncbi:hypothetical protein ACEP3I_22155 [Pseudomonas aeruginosa]